VVPLYETVNVSLSTIVPVPLREKLQLAMPGMLAVPDTVSGTSLPFNWPDAVPEIVRPPAQVAENVPVSEDPA
jgi:hypothetical protein